MQFKVIKNLNPERLRVIRVDNVPEDEKFNWASAFATMSDYTVNNARGVHPRDFKHIKFKRYMI